MPSAQPTYLPPLLCFDFRLDFFSPNPFPFRLRNLVTAHKYYKYMFLNTFSLNFAPQLTL